MSRDELMEEGNKLIACAQALDNKEKSINDLDLNRYPKMLQ
jgi:hypothetical protein